MTRSHALLGNNFRYDEDSGRWLSAEHQRVAEVIKDYDPNLELVWIPPEGRTEEEDRRKPFGLVHRQPDGHTYLIFTLSEAEVNHTLLARIFEADMHKHDPTRTINKIELNEQAMRLMQAKKIEEQKQEYMEFAHALLKSPLHTYRHNGKVYR